MYPYQNIPMQRPGAGKDTLAVVFGMISLIGCFCLGPIAVIFGVLAIIFALQYRRMVGVWSSSAAIALGAGSLGILFSTFLTVFLIYVIVTQDMESIYGMIVSMAEEGSSLSFGASKMQSFF